MLDFAFGEIHICWGILWRPLPFSLDSKCKVIDACMHLHNFIVDFCEGEVHCVLESTALDRDVFDDVCRHNLATQLEQNEDGVHDG